jgi:hypothetical protein
MKRKGVVAGCWLFVVSCSLLATSVAAATPTAEKITLWPFLYYSPTDTQTDLEVLWPLFDSQQSADKNTWRLLLTAYQHSRSKKETAWDLLWPIWRVRYDEAGHAHSRFVPLFFGHDANERYAVLFPEFWWSLRNDGRYTIALLPWGRHKGTDAYTNYLTPAIWGRDRDERFGMVLPLAYWKFVGEKNRSLYLFPFLRYRNPPAKSVTALLPWWVSKSNDEEFANLFPVLWKKRGDTYESFVVFPLYYRTKKSSVLFPLYWDVGETTLAIPFYGKGEWRRWKWETILPPTYVRWDDGNYAETDILWPLVAWGDGKDRRVRAFRPIFDYVRKSEYEQRSMLLRLIAHGQGGGRELSRFFPLFNYDHKGETKDFALLWPFYREKSTKDSQALSALSVLPIGLFRLNKPADSFSALNLFWWGESRDKEKLGAVTESHGLYPLYSYDKENVQWGVPPKAKGKGGSDAEKKNVRTNFRLLDLLTPLDSPHFKVSEIPIISWILPFLEHSQDKNGWEKWALPLGLFDWRKQPEWQQLMVGTPFLFFDSWREQGHGLHIATLFWDNVRESPKGAKPGVRTHSQGLWPIYTYKRNASGGINASLLDPLWFWGEATGEEEHVSALLKIFDYRRQPNGDNRFFFIWRAYHRDKRGDAVSWEAFPFLNWDSSPEHSRFSFLWRLFEYEKATGKRSMRLFFSPKIRLGGK